MKRKISIDIIRESVAVLNAIMRLELSAGLACELEELFMETLKRMKEQVAMYKRQQEERDKWKQ